MHHFWDSVIEPALSLLRPQVIVEIGSGSGTNTKHLLEFCRAHGAVLHAIDPAPQFDVSAWLREYRDRLVFHQCRSLEALLKLGPADVFLIDGDHNWYTVFHELLLIQNLVQQNRCPFPLVMLHDIDWPYGRRDLYYNPAEIPAQFLKAYRQKGMTPDCAELNASGGLNPDLNNAVAENDAQNGVLTAVEDFLKDAREALELIRVPGFHGLGLLLPASLKATNPGLHAILNDARTNNLLQVHIISLEKTRILSEIAANEAERNRRAALNALSEEKKAQQAQMEAVALTQTSRERELERRIQEALQAKAVLETAVQNHISRESEWLSQLQNSARANEELAAELAASTRRVGEMDLARKAELEAMARARQSREGELQRQVQEAVQEHGTLRAELELVRRQAAESQLSQQAELEAAERRNAYCRLVLRIRQVADEVLPRRATVIVVSKGDDDLLKLGRRAWHFPRAEDGVYAGYYPADDGEAVAHLEKLRAMGGEFLIFPETAFWWLDYYRGFRDYLDNRCGKIWSDDSCIVFRVSRPLWPFSGYQRMKKKNGNLARWSLKQSPAVTEAAGKKSPSLPASHPASSGRPEPDRSILPSEPTAPPPASHLRFVLDHAETLPLSPPQTDFDAGRMNLHWVIPDFDPGMGGHMAIFRMIKLLESFGHENTIWIRGETKHGTAGNARRVIREIVPIDAPVRLLLKNVHEVAGDAVIATHCWTAFPVRAVTRVRERFYFVQDFEPSFYPMGSEYLFAEATYRFGLTCITSGKWLQKLLQSRYRCKASHFTYAHDPAIYHEEPGEPRGDNRIVFYARTTTPRRAVELGLFALELLARRCPAFVVDFFGAHVGAITVPYTYHDHGILNDRQLAQLYRQSTMGLVFSTTNYSLLLHEMMACGLPVIDLAGENTAVEFPDGALALSEPTPEAIASTMERLLENPSLRQAQALRAKQFVEQFTWEKSARQVESAIVDGILARTVRRENSPDGRACKPLVGANDNARLSIDDSLPAKAEPGRGFPKGVGDNSQVKRPDFFGPIVFAGQPEYYRSTYYDLTSTGRHFEFPLTSADWSVLRGLPQFARERGARTCVVFRPEWFAPYREAFMELKSDGMAVIGYSSEPVPHNSGNVHSDQSKRLESLKKALELEYDLIIHYDSCSIEFLRGLGFSRILAHPLPVSRKLFYPENRPREFDVCFIGKSTPHREEMLLPLKMRFNTVHVAHGLCDNEARTLMNRSKLVLNLHNEDYLNFENRVVQALFCRRPILSERLCGDLLLAGLDYLLVTAPDDLCRKVTSLLNGEVWNPRERDLSAFTIEALLANINFGELHEECGVSTRSPVG